MKLYYVIEHLHDDDMADIPPIQRRTGSSQVASMDIAAAIANLTPGQGVEVTVEVLTPEGDE
jgi:hypothetical protein